MRVSAAVAIAVALPALAAGILTGIFLRPDPAPEPRPRPAIRPAPATPPPPPPAVPIAPPADNPDGKLLASLCRSGGVKMFLPADQIPKPVLDAVRDQLRSGTADQKLAILRLIEEAGWFGGDPPIKKEEIVDRATAFLADNDPRVRAIAVPILQRYAPQQVDPRFEVLQELWRTSKDPDIRATCMGALGQMTSPEARQLMLQGAAQVASDPEAMKDRRLMGTALGALSSHAPWLPPEEVASICASALRTTQEPLAFQGWAELALRLPLPQATTLLEQARDGAPTADLQDGAKRALEQIRAGETRTDRLLTAFRKTK